MQTKDYKRNVKQGKRAKSNEKLPTGKMIEIYWSVSDIGEKKARGQDSHLEITLRWGKMDVKRVWGKNTRKLWYGTLLQGKLLTYWQERDRGHDSHLEITLLCNRKSYWNKVRKKNETILMGKFTRGGNYWHTEKDRKIFTLRNDVILREKAMKIMWKNENILLENLIEGKTIDILKRKERKIFSLRNHVILRERKGYENDVREENEKIVMRNLIKEEN